MIHVCTKTVTWYRGFPQRSGMYLVELADGEHCVTPYTIPGHEGEDSYGDKRRAGWSCLTHSRATVIAWAEIPKARAAGILEGATPMTDDIATQPLPDEIAELIGSLELTAAWFDYRSNSKSAEQCRKVTVVLRALAQENERLSDLTGFSPAVQQAMHQFEAVLKMRKRAEAAEERIRELEAERDLQTKLKDRALQSAAINQEAMKKCQLLLCPDFGNEECELGRCVCFENGPYANSVPKNRRAEKAESERAALRRKTIEECAQAVLPLDWHDARCYKAIRALAQSERGEGKIEDDKDLPTAEDVRGILRPEK